MKILVLTNNQVAKPLINWLKTQREEVVTWSKEISTVEIASLKPDYVLSYCYRFIIKSDVIALLPKKIINLHISYLPWNRGADPNIWSFLDNTPKGVTIHYVDEGLDTGPIICQKLLYFSEQMETFRSTYITLHLEIQSLFKENWSFIRSSSLKEINQSRIGSYHRIKDMSSIKEKFGDSLYDTKIALFKRRLHNKQQL